jgi:hypothetical protein
MAVPDVVRLKELEAENTQMHRIIAKLTLKVDAMDTLIRKNGWPSQRQEAVRAFAAERAQSARGVQDHASASPAYDGKRFDPHAAGCTANGTFG